MEKLRRLAKFAADWGSHLTFADYLWRISVAAGTFLLTVAAAMTPWLETIGPIGWFLVALGCTALLAWVIVPASLKIVTALRQLGLLPAMQPRRAATALIEARSTPAQTLLSRHLHVGQMFMDVSRLRAERYIKLSFSLYNGLSQNILISGINGSIVYREEHNGNATIVDTLPQPMLTYIEGQAKEAEPLTEYLASLHQAVPADLADRMAQFLEGGGVAHLDFDKLNVITSLSGDSSQAFRIPLWGGATLAKRPCSYICSRALGVGGDMRFDLGVSG